MPRKEESVEVMEGIIRAIRAVGDAITPPALPGHDETGGTVASLTEAVMGMTAGLVRVAESISDLADAVRETKGEG